MPEGRPSKKHLVDWDQVEKLASYFCSQDEIASIVGIPRQTLQGYPEFSAIYKKSQANAKVGLRRSQLKMAEVNPTMAIWLGKQMLGQTDRPELQETVDNAVDDIEKLKAEIKTLVKENGFD